MKRHLELILAAALVALAALIVPASAADKGGPPQKIDAQGFVKPMFSSCYLSGGAVGVFADSDALRGFTAGLGCDVQRGRLIVGGVLEYTFGESDNRMAAISARLGFALNSHTAAYGKLGLAMDGRDLKVNDSLVMLGGGVETYLDRNVTLFLEASQSVAGFGDAKGAPTVSVIHGGVRYRF